MFILFTYPLYALLLQPGFFAQFFALLIFALLAAGIVGTVPATLSEMFATHARYSGVAISYNIDFAIFAGLTPVIATYLLYTLGYPQAVSINLIVSANFTLIACISIRDRYDQTLTDMPSEFLNEIRWNL